jgi:hypothetical protein
MPESPAPHPPPFSPNEPTTKYGYTDYDPDLNQIIALPNITGAALVVGLGNEMECIRSIGDAPPIGSRSHTGMGLTGISFSGGKVELCNNVENDSRADLRACADLGVRSVLVIPIWHSSRVVGVLEALSSTPNAFDWRNIRHIRRVAQAFDSATLESWVHSPERQATLEQLASLSTAQTDELKVQGKKRAFETLQPFKEVASQRYIDPPAFEAREDASPSLLTSKEEFLDKSRSRRLAGSVTVLVILLLCSFEFRTHLITLSALLDVVPRLEQASSRSFTAASRKAFRNELALPPAPGSHVVVKGSAPTPRTAMQSSAGRVAKFEKPGQNYDAEASWHQAFAYLKGVGVPQDEWQAAKWLKRAANLGDPTAQAALSDLYLRGIGVQRDYVRAYTWATIAAAKVGGEDERLAFLQQRMTRSELADANRRIQTWFHAQKASR